MLYLQSNGDDMKEPRVNVYTCQKCGAYTVTVDVDYGVTPFMLKCRTTEGCEGFGHSSFYPTGPKPVRIPEPSWEWYKPSEQEASTLDPQTLDHVELGGLILRPRTQAEPVYHSERR